VEYNAITISWDGVAGATKYQFWWGTTNDSAVATQYPVDITSGLSITLTVQNTGTYYGWIKAGNSQGDSGFSPVATATVTSLDPVIGAWQRPDGNRTTTYTFKPDGTLEWKQEGDGDEWTSDYTYDSATKKIYDAWSGELRGTYSISGTKLSITETYSQHYERQGTGSDLSGTWRRNYDVGFYDEYVFASGKVTEKYVYDGEVESERSYSYTVSGTKITYTQEQLIGSLSEGRLNVFMGDGEPTQLTRQGNGSGVIGTWLGSTERGPVTLTVTSSKMTATMSGESEEYSCRISGNDLYAIYSWDETFIIDTSATPPILTLTEEWTNEYTRVK
jgi:hypothetical protein